MMIDAIRLRSLTADVATAANAILAPGQRTKVEAAAELARIARDLNAMNPARWSAEELQLLLSRARAV